MIERFGNSLMMSIRLEFKKVTLFTHRVDQLDV